MIFLLTPSKEDFIFSQFLFILFCFSEPYPDPAKKRTHLVILGALLLFLSVTLTIIFCLKRDGISFIVIVSIGVEEKCMRVLLLSQWHLVGRARDAKSPVICRIVPCNRELFYPKC